MLGNVLILNTSNNIGEKASSTGAYLIYLKSHYQIQRNSFMKPANVFYLKFPSSVVKHNIYWVHLLGWLVYLFIVFLSSIELWAFCHFLGLWMAHNFY